MSDIKKTPIIINVSLQVSDLEDFYNYTSKRSIVMKMLIACALIIFISQLIRIAVTPEALEQDAWKWILGVIGLFFLLYYINKSNAQKEFKSNKKLHEKHMYQINEESIHIKGGPFNTVFEWEKLYNLTESKKSFFIWLSKSSVQIIPKREMTATEISQLQTLKKIKFGK